MSASIYLFANYDRVRIECEEGDDTIWIRGNSETIALVSLKAAELDALESAIATARAALRELA